MKLPINIEKELPASSVGPGRKYILGRTAMLLLVACYLMTHFSSLLGSNFVTLIGGITGLYGLYCGGNIGDTFASNRPQVQVVADRRRVSPPVESPPKVPPTTAG